MVLVTAGAALVPPAAGHARAAGRRDASVGGGTASLAGGRRSSTAIEIVTRAMDAMGGEGRLRGLHTLRIAGQTFEWHLYEAEPPNQPFYLTSQHFTEWRDLDHRRFRRVAWVTDSSRAQVQKGDGGVLEIRQAGTLRTTGLHPGWVDMSPERVLLTAATAPDLRAIGDTAIGGMPAVGVGFTWAGTPVRIWLDAATALPVRVEYVEAYPESISAGAWGDVGVSVTFGAWELHAGGLHYPAQSNAAWNGVPFRTTVLSDVAAGAQLADSAYALSEEARAAARRPGTLDASGLPLGQPDRPPTEIKPGVVQIPGAWYTTLIRQPDGIVVLEAPISAGYSAKVLAYAADRFPGVPIKAVITTSNYWWHVAGLREYVARGIPVYGLDRNQELIQRIASAPHRLAPDALQRHPRALQFRAVSRKLVVGTGPNRLELYPIRSSTTSLMLMVYMPEHALLYSSDMAQPLGPGGSFLFPQYLWDLRRATTANGLAVKTLIGMHMSPTPWTALEATLDSLGT